MKKLLLLTLALAVAMPALAQDAWIGVYADEAGTTCDVTLTPYVASTLYVLAYVPTYTEGIVTAEFKINDYMDNPGYPTGQVTEAWTSELTIGTVDEDFTIAWPTPQIPDGNGVVLIGTLEVLAFDAAWIPADYMISVGAGDNCDCILVVDDVYDTFDVFGDVFTFNCTAACACAPSATEDATWSSIKALY